MKNLKKKYIIFIVSKRIIEVVAQYKCTYRDFYEDYDVDEEYQQYLCAYRDRKKELYDYKAFKEANAELFENTDYYIVETSYVRRLFGWTDYKGCYKRYLSIIAVEARNDSGFYDNGPMNIQLYDARSEEGQYLLDNLSNNIEFTDNTKMYLGGWVGFKAHKELDVPKCVETLAEMRFCGGLYLYDDMEVIWFKLPNGKIAAICELDTESG